MTKYVRAVHDRTSPAPHDVLGRTSWRLSGGYVQKEPRQRATPSWSSRVFWKTFRSPEFAIFNRDEADEKNLVEQKKRAFFNSEKRLPTRPLI